MQSLGGGKANEDSGKGDGGASAAEGLYVGTNMSQEFIDANKKYLDPDGDGCVADLQRVFFACGFGCSRIALSAAPELLFGQFCTCAFGKPEEKSLT